MAYCTHCGVKMDDDAAFCKECGAPVPVNDAPKNETGAQPQQPEAEALKKEAPVAKAPSYAAPQPAKKKFSPKKFLLIAGSAVVGVMLISMVITIISVASSERSLSDLWQSFDYSYDYDYNYDYDYDYDYDDYDDYYDDDNYGDYYDDYSNLFIGSFFMVDIPDSWQGHYTYEEADDSVTFYNTENANVGFGGMLFSICRYAPGSDYQDLPNYRVLSETDEYTYLVLYPSDVQYDYENETLSSIYQEMSDDAETALFPEIQFY